MQNILRSDSETHGLADGDIHLSGVEPIARGNQGGLDVALRVDGDTQFILCKFGAQMKLEESMVSMAPGGWT